MMDKKTYLEELARYFNSVRNKDYNDEVVKSPTKCCGVSCRNCIFKGEGNITCIFSLKNIFDALEILEKWSKEHPQKYKISPFEYEYLKLYQKYGFGSDRLCDLTGTTILHELFYLKDIDLNVKVEDILLNCEVAEDVR